MTNRSKLLYLLFYFVVSLFLMEIILRIATTSDLFTSGLFISFIFSASFASLFYLVSSFFNGKYRWVIGAILLGIAGFVFSAQLVYHDAFRTYFSMYSAGNATQIADFWKDIVTLVVQNVFWIVLLFLPMFLLIVFRKIIVYSQACSRIVPIVFLCSFVSFHLFGIGTLYFGDKEQHSAYDLYFNSRNPILSVDRLGLMTTMRVDLQRLLFDWSPTVAVSKPIISNTTDPALNNSHSEDIGGEVEDSDKNTEDEIIQEKIEYNRLSLDFSQLIKQTDNEEIIEMHQYFNSINPTEKNEFTGKYEGYNFIFITAESFAPFAVHEEVTPTLYKMIHEGYHFTDFYTPIWEVSTTDGEYVALNSLLPKSGVWSFEASAENELPFVMGNQFKNLGYKTIAYHNHTYDYYRRDISHPNMGYDYKGIGNGLEVRQIWPASDLEMMEFSIPEYIEDEPFHAYYMTVSGHMQYSFSGNNMARKNMEAVESLPYSEQGRAYVATHVELDRALEHLLRELEEAGIADKTLIAISSDHYPYGLDDKTIDELAGHEVEKTFELYKNNFILYTKNMEPMTIDKPSSSLDIIPTLSNLFGLEYDSRLLMGTDIFSNTDPLVMFLDRSFITDKGKYNAVTREFIPNDGVEVDQEYIDTISNIVNSKFYFSTKILENNYYKEIMESYQTVDEK